MKIALVVTDNFSMWNFRRGLLRMCAAAGHDTYALTPSGKHDADIRELGVNLLPITVDRFMNPPRDVAFALQLYRLFRRHRFDIVHNVSIKPNIYGSIAAHMAQIPAVFGSVTGRGTLFMDDAAPYVRTLRKAVIPLYRFALSKTERVWFQNKDDADFFVSKGLVQADKVVVIRSSGIDVADFAGRSANLASKRNELQIDDSTAVITMVSRTLWSKGVEEFIESSKIVGRSFPRAKFLLIGEGETRNPEAIPRSYLEQHKSPSFEWLGWRTDVREILAVSDAAVLLARHGEGVPRSLLEAMALKKPVIATDVPGCREVIEDGRNGYLVPPRSPEAVAAAVGRLLQNPEQRSIFGKYSYQKVSFEFDQNKVNTMILHDLYRVPNGRM